MPQTDIHQKEQDMDFRHDRYRDRGPGWEQERGGPASRDWYSEPYGEGQQWSQDRERGARYRGEGDARRWARNYYGRGEESGYRGRERGMDTPRGPRGGYGADDYRAGEDYRGSSEYRSPMSGYWDERGGRDYRGGAERGGHGYRDVNEYTGGEAEREGYGWRDEGRGGRHDEARGGWRDEAHSGHGERAGSQWQGGSPNRGAAQYAGGPDYGGGSGHDERSGGGAAFAGSYGYEGLSFRRRGGSLGGVRRGPKGYTRSDSRIEEDINDRLFQTEHIDSREVQVKVKDGRVVLSGTVSERWMKHAIEDEAAQCPGVQDVENNVRVVRSGDSDSAPGQHGSAEGRAASSLPLAGTTTVGGASSQFGGSGTAGGGQSTGTAPSGGSAGNASGGDNKGKKDQLSR